MSETASIIANAGDCSRAGELHSHSLPDADGLPRECCRLRVAMLTNEIPPYRVPLYRTLAATLGWEFMVFTCVERELNRQWKVAETLGFAHKQSRSWFYMRRLRGAELEDPREMAQVHLPVGLAWDLWRYRPDVILSLEMGARSLIAATYARLAGIPLLLYFEGTPHTERRISTAQRMLRGLLRRVCDAIICNGTEGRRYLESIGAPPDRVFEVGQATDTAPFQLRPTATEREAVRQRLGIAGWCCLFSGRLVSGKGISQLLEAWPRFCDATQAEATLLFVGDGPERTQLEKTVSAGGQRNVRFLGFVQHEELPAIYHAADAFVLPSLQDCWALVVGEAMAAGLPVIDSKYNGGAVELVSEGENGWIADPLAPDDLFKKLRLAWEARDRKDAMGAAAMQSAARISIEAVAERMRGAVADTVSRSRGRHDGHTSAQSSEPRIDVRGIKAP